MPISHKLKLHAHSGLLLSDPTERTLPYQEIEKQYIEMAYYISDSECILPLDLDTKFLDKG